DGDVRDERPVHHVDVEPVGAGRLGGDGRVAEPREVGGEDRRRQADDTPHSLSLSAETLESPCRRGVARARALLIYLAMVMADATAAADPRLALLGEHAAAMVADGARIGLGSGRAAVAFLHALAGRVRSGLGVTGVPTSEGTARIARDLGIAVGELDATPLVLTVDGADEVDPHLDLIKGRGGARSRQRMVAAASQRQVILVTPDKLVPRLGARGRLPVEVVMFARPFCERRIVALGFRPELRMQGETPFRSDNGNLILDCAIDRIEDPP